MRARESLIPGNAIQKARENPRAILLLRESESRSIISMCVLAATSLYHGERKDRYIKLPVS